MIRVNPAPEPVSFNDKVRLPGLRAIQEMVGIKTTRRGRPRKVVAINETSIKASDFPPYWTEALLDLKIAYNYICAYSCFRIHEITGAASVDHMVAKSISWDSVYEWNNYRLACSRLNANKSVFEDILDPFDIDDNWFHLELVGFQIKPNEGISDEALINRIIHTVDTLKLNSSEFRNRRTADAEEYWAGEISLSRLNKYSPFVASELSRQGRLNPCDVVRI